MYKSNPYRFRTLRELIYHYYDIICIQRVVPILMSLQERESKTSVFSSLNFHIGQTEYQFYEPPSIHFLPETLANK